MLKISRKLKIPKISENSHPFKIPGNFPALCIPTLDPCSQHNIQSLIHFKILSTSKLKLSMFCALFQNYQLFFFFLNDMSTGILKQSVSETQKWYKNFSRPSSFWVIDQTFQNSVLINNSGTMWPTKMLCLSSSDNFLQDAYIICLNSVDNFEIEHKMCSILVWGCSSPLMLTIISGNTIAVV